MTAADPGAAGILRTAIRSRIYREIAVSVAAGSVLAAVLMGLIAVPGGGSADAKTGLVAVVALLLIALLALLALRLIALARCHAWTRGSSGVAEASPHRSGPHRVGPVTTSVEFGYAVLHGKRLDAFCLFRAERPLALALADRSQGDLVQLDLHSAKLQRPENASIIAVGAFMPPRPELTFSIAELLVVRRSKRREFSLLCQSADGQFAMGRYYDSEGAALDAGRELFENVVWERCRRHPPSRRIE